MKGSQIMFGGLLFLFAIPVSIVLATILFYAEESWRGQHTWAVAKAELEQKGEPVDYAALIPPTVPDDQNLGALPIFRLDPDPTENNALRPVALSHALQNISSNEYHLPVPSRMFSGKTADLKTISTSISQRYRIILKPNAGIPEPTALEELEALCPALAEIRTAALTRPFCRFNQDYTSMPPYVRPLGLSTTLIHVDQALSLHGVLALHANKPDVAFDDLKTLFKIDAELRKEPVMVDGLVAVGTMAIAEQIIWEGLNIHVWNDSQLSELANLLKNVEFFSTYQLCLRGEAIGFFAPQMDLEEKNLKTSDITGMSNPKDETAQDIEGEEGIKIIAWLAPRGWFSLSKTIGVRLLYDAADEGANPSQRRFYPQQVDKIQERVRPKDIYSPGEILRGVAMGPILNSGSAFAQSQSQVDTAYIATLAERYRLLHGSYPTSLDALATSFSEELPHDVVNGEPYHYVVEPNGSFLLYSIGWDLVDEDGQRAYKPDDKSLDRKRGDWPWPALGIDETKQ